MEAGRLSYTFIQNPGTESNVTNLNTFDMFGTGLVTL